MIPDDPLMPKANMGMMPEDDFFMNNFLSPSVMHRPQQSDGLIKWQLEPSDIIEEIEHYLKGMVWDTKKKCYIVIPDRRMMNDKGINKFLTILRGHLSKIMSLSNLSNDEIKRLSRECRQAVIDEIYYNGDLFDIDNSFRDTLVMVIDHKVYCFLKQAKDGGMQRFLRETERRTEVLREGEGSGDGKKKGLSSLKFW